MNVEEMAISLNFRGFSDKLFQFAEIFIDILLECAKEGGFDDEQVMNSIEKRKSEYANTNIDVDEHATNNRLLFLLPHTYHDSLMVEVLTKRLDERVNGDKSFCPG